MSVDAETLRRLREVGSDKGFSEKMETLRKAFVEDLSKFERDARSSQPSQSQTSPQVGGL
ncbi:hypothetical protein [Neptuniibacter sp. QD37_11]|uniref:hypothetical protein n=1 Tax=Neptuniibacter sp. QD37_11 TaxID=3398209 RepID=UPI0039F52E8A